MKGFPLSKMDAAYYLLAKLDTAEDGASLDILSGEQIYHKRNYIDDREQAVKVLTDYDTFKAFDEVANYAHREFEKNVTGADLHEIEYNYCLMIESYRDPVKLATQLAIIRANQVYKSVLDLTGYCDYTKIDEKVKKKVSKTLDYLIKYWNDFE